MRQSIAGLILACALLAPASAQERTEPSFGPFRPSMTATEAMEAAPNLEWQIIRDRESNAVVGAVAPAGLAWNDAVWDVSIGDRYGSRRFAYVRSLDFERELETRNSAACRDELRALVTLLEPAYGAFGQHPAFAGSRNTLYAAPYGPFRLASAGASSRIRVVAGGPVDFDVYYTFNELDEDRGHAIALSAEYIDEFNLCKLRVHDFIDNDRIGRAGQSRASPG